MTSSAPRQGLQGSVAAVVVGGLIALYGSMGLGQAIQNAMHVVWSVPRNSRPNPIRLRVKSLLLLLFAGVALVTITAVSVISRETHRARPGRRARPALGDHAPSTRC